MSYLCGNKRKIDKEFKTLRLLFTASSNDKFNPKWAGGGTEERTLMNSQTQSTAFDGGQI